MMLPATYLSTLLLLIFSMVCWGSWANTQKAVGKWRFELFYYDYSFGVVIAAVIAAFTFGSMNAHELTFSDNLLIASLRKMAWAIGSGVVFNLANLLLVAAIAVSGLAVAFPVSIGLALVIGVIWNYALNPQGNATLIFGGAALVLVAMIVDGFAYSRHLSDKAEAAAAARLADPRSKARTPRKTSAARGVVISILSGILMGLFYPMLEISKTGEDGVSPYGVALLFSIGILASSLLYLPFFMYFPIQGEPIQARDYFSGTKGQHFWGLFGGLIWAAGGIANFTASSAPLSVQVGPAISYALGQGSVMVSTLWGLLVWREFAGATTRVKTLLVVMLVLFVCGLATVSIAPLYAK